MRTSHGASVRRSRARGSIRSHINIYFERARRGALGGVGTPGGQRVATKVPTYCDSLCSMINLASRDLFPEGKYFSRFQK